MKKLIFVLSILYIISALASCSTTPEISQVLPAEQSDTPALETAKPTDSPTIAPSTAKDRQSIDIPFKQVQIDDGVITLDLPAAFEEIPNNIGHIYTAEGYASLTGDGNQFTFHVLRFYQQEDIMTSIEMLLEFGESIETYQYSSKITYKNLMQNLYFGDAIGHLSKIEIGTDEKYTATLYAGDTYYKIILYSQGDFAADELALRIMTSINVNGKKAIKKAQQFNLLLDENIYSSHKLDEASVLCPEKWSPAESMYFSLENSILSMMNETMEATATVRYYPKSELPDIQSYDEFSEYMTNDLINRGFISADDIENISTFETEKRSYVLYPSDIIFIHYNIEYDEAFYCIELIYTGIDTEVVAQLIDIGQSFTGIGKEVEK